MSVEGLATVFFFGEIVRDGGASSSMVGDGLFGPVLAIIPDGSRVAGDLLSVVMAFVLDVLAGVGTEVFSGFANGSATWRTSGLLDGPHPTMIGQMNHSRTPNQFRTTSQLPTFVDQRK
ncbi:MAG: hypothetical protein Q8M16_24440 [Pirellulaceae bacterium]|nr:hypothetical protein [Pirellulaceae bacterium]